MFGQNAQVVLARGCFVKSFCGDHTLSPGAVTFISYKAHLTDREMQDVYSDDLSMFALIFISSYPELLYCDENDVTLETQQPVVGSETSNTLILCMIIK